MDMYRVLVPSAEGGEARQKTNRWMPLTPTCIGAVSQTGPLSVAKKVCHRSSCSGSNDLNSVGVDSS